MKIRCIYAVKSLLDGRLLIGSTGDFKKRRKKHLQDLRKGKHSAKELQELWNSFPELVSFDIIEILDEDTNLFNREAYWIIKLDTTHILKGFNKIIPCENYVVPKYKKEYSEKFLLEKGPTNLKAMTKEKWIENRRAVPTFKVADLKQKYEFYRKSVVAIDKLSGEVSYKYSSVKEGSLTFSKKEDYLTKYLQYNSTYPKRFKVNNNFIWMYEKDYDKERVASIINTPKPKRSRKKEKPISYSQRNLRKRQIILRHLNTLQLKSFPSITEAAKFLNTTNSKIHCLLKGIENKGRGRVSKITSIKGWGVL